MREVMFHLLGQMLRISNPVAGFAGASRLIMAQVLVQSLDKLDAFTQRNTQTLVGHILEVPEVLHTCLPTATVTRAVIAPFAGGFEHILVVVVVVVDQLLEQQAGIHERFYELLSHRILLSTMHSDYAYWTVYSTAINGMLDA
jgi:hypothetical protein